MGQCPAVLASPRPHRNTRQGPGVRRLTACIFPDAFRSGHGATWQRTGAGWPLVRVCADKHVCMKRTMFGVSGCVGRWVVVRVWPSLRMCLPNARDPDASCIGLAVAAEGGQWKHHGPVPLAKDACQRCACVHVCEQHNKGASGPFSGRGLAPSVGPVCRATVSVPWQYLSVGESHLECWAVPR